MTDAKIRVGIDVPAIQADLAKVQEAARKVTGALNGGKLNIDTGTAKRALDGLVSDAESLADKLGEIGDLDILDADSLAQGVRVLESAAKAASDMEKAMGGKGGRAYGLSKAIEEFKAVEAHIRRVGKAQEALSREGIRLSRQEVEARKNAYDRLLRDGSYGTGRLRREGVGFDEFVEGGSRRFGSRISALVRQETGLPEAARDMHRDTLMRTAGTGILTQFMPGGVGGQVMHRAVTDAAAMEGGLFSGQGMALLGKGALLGGAAYGVVKAVQGVRENMDSASREAVEISDLRRMIGPLSHDFEALRGEVRDLTDDFGLTTDESVKLAHEMAHTSGVVGEDVRTGAQFARDYGMEPGAAGRFFAEMRHVGAARNEADNRRLALMIGEAVNGSGTRHRTDELLAAVEGLATATARQSLTAPHVGNYIEAISGLTGSGLPGLAGDPGMAGMLMAAVDNAMRRGGMFGEASKSFRLGLIQREFPGANALDMGLIDEGGAFGTVRDAVGENSPAYRLAKVLGDTANQRRYEGMAQQDAGTPNLVRVLAGHRAMSGGDTSMLIKSLAGDLGVSDNQAAALGAAWLQPGGFDRLQKNMRRQGLDPNNIKQAAPYAEMLFDPSAAERQWQRIKATKGAESEKAKISGLIEGNNGKIGEDATREIAALAAKLGFYEDEGSAARKAAISLDREFEKFASQLIPLTTWVKDGIVELVRMLPTESARKYTAKQEELKALAEAEARTPGDIKKAAAAYAAAKTPKERRAVIDGLRELDRQHPGFHSDEYRRALDDLERGANAYDGGGAAKRRDKAAALSPDHRSVLDDVAKRHNFDPALLREVLNREGSGAHAVSRKGAVGEFQIMPGNFEGTGLDPTKFEDGAELAARVLDDAIKLYGNDRAAVLSYYNGGRAAGDAVHAGKRAPSAETRRYLEETGAGDFEAKLRAMQEAAPPDIAKSLRILRDKKGATGYGYMGKHGLDAMEWSDSHAAEFGLQTPILRDYQGGDGFGDKVPARHRGGESRQSMRFDHTHNHTITLMDRDGNPIAAPTVSNSRVGPPVPAGVEVIR